MKKLINVPENYVNEMLEGIYLAHPDHVTYTQAIYAVWSPPIRWRERWESQPEEVLDIFLCF